MLLVEPQISRMARMNSLLIRAIREIRGSKSSTKKLGFVD